MAMLSVKLLQRLSSDLNMMVSKLLDSEVEVNPRPTLHLNTHRVAAVTDELQDGQQPSDTLDEAISALERSARSRAGEPTR